jgi:hypothetical protein
MALILRSADGAATDGRLVSHRSDDTSPDNIDCSANTDLVFYYENNAFFDIIGRDETFSEHGCQVSGFRLAFAFSLLTPET